MQIGIVTIYSILNQENNVFNPSSYVIGDNLGYPFIRLKYELKKRDIEFNTTDVQGLENYKKIIFFDIPTKNVFDIEEIAKFYDMEFYLVLFESELIAPKNYVRENHKYFEKVFTWNDRWVDGKKYIKYYWPNKIPANLDFDLNRKNKFCTLIAGNKSVKHPLELYSERINAIRWFERYHPEEFDLYGVGWDKHVFRGRIINRLNKIEPLTRLLAPKYPSYKGAIESKAQILKDYKFAICYENARDIPGYITEKIFDCFFAGCVPVYWGAPNITDFIPASTFIDKRNFKSYEELYRYLKTMPIAEYERYLAAIERFVKSDAMHLFSAEYFADMITAEITESLTLKE